MMDTHLLITVLTLFGTEYCPHLCLEDEETRPYFSPESLYPSVREHGALLHTTGNKFAFFTSSVRVSANCMYHQAERLKIAVCRPHFVVQFMSHLFLTTQRD